MTTSKKKISTSRLVSPDNSWIHLIIIRSDFKHYEDEKKLEGKVAHSDT